MFRTILVPLAGDAAAMPDALETAGNLATIFDAHLVGLHVRTDGTTYLDALSGGGLLGSVPAEELAELIDRDGDRHCQAVRRQFQEFCSRRNIPLLLQASASPQAVSAELQVEYGDPADVIASAGRACDIIVMRRPVDTGVPQGVLHAALFETGRPVLLAGPRPAIAYDRVVIGWRPSAEAARAVAAAMPFLERAKTIEVVCVDADADHRLDTLRLVDSLRWRGMAAIAQPVVSDGDGEGEALLSAVRRGDGDLLVMGGFGHNRFSQFVIGGVSRHILQHGDCAVLLAH